MDTHASFRLSIIYHSSDGPVARRYSDWLQLRDISVLEKDISGLDHLDEFEPSGRALLICSPRVMTEDALLPGLSKMVENLFPNIATLVIEPMQLPGFLEVGPLIREYHLGPDLSFEQVLRFTMGPLPEWLQLFCRPSQTQMITGACWWGDDIIVADQYYDHVVKLRNQTSVVLLAGLDEPSHLHLDRRDLLIANTGVHEIICARLRGGTLWNLSTFHGSFFGRELKRPHGAFQGGGYSAIADTDNHRILFKSGHFETFGEWTETTLELNFPCAVHCSDNGLWIADTFGQRLIDLSLSASVTIRSSIEGSGTAPGKMAFPVGLCMLGKLLFVSDEQNKRLQCFRKHGTGWTVLSSEVGAPWIGSPFGLSVNRGRKLLIGDRDRGCCWVIDLRQAGLHWD